MQKNQEPKQPQDTQLKEGDNVDKLELRKQRKEEETRKKQLAKEKKAEDKEKDNNTKTKDKEEREGKKGKKKEIIPQQYIDLVNSQQIPLLKQYQIPREGQENILITSALPYVNNVPHLGNLIGCVLSADVFARFKRLVGDNTMYICGTDEYGSATVIKGLLSNKTPQQICDFYFQIHSDIYKWFNISFDYFGRTSTEWHTKITQEIYQMLNSHKYINKSTIQQAYCQKCDLFLADRFVVGQCPYKECSFPAAKGDQCDKCGKTVQDPLELVNPQCFVCKTTPVAKETDHYFLELTDIQPQLQQWLNDSCIKGGWSNNSTCIAKSWLKQGLLPKCITRDLKWGVPVPGEEKKVFYVWFDAPIGYISITANLIQEEYKKWWMNPKDVKLYQFMGKDNVPFHTVIFPASLIGTKEDWTLLHHISTSEYLQYEGGKFSKSDQTGVFGDDAKNTGIPCDVWRYYLLINRPQKSDSNFYWTDLADKNNNELVANIGNLCNRALDFAYSQYKQIPRIQKATLTPADLAFLETVEQSVGLYVETLNRVEIKDGLKVVMSISSIGNKYLQDSQFWEAESKTSGRTQTVIAVIVNFIRLLSALVEPYLPETAAKINFFLGLSERTQRDSKLLQFISQKPFVDRFVSLTENSVEMRLPIIIFSKITEEEINAHKARFGDKETLLGKKLEKTEKGPAVSEQKMEVAAEVEGVAKGVVSKEQVQSK